MFVFNPSRDCSTYGSDFVTSAEGSGCIGMISDMNPSGNSSTTFYKATREGIFFRSVGPSTSHVYWNLTATPPSTYSLGTPADAGATETQNGILFSTWGLPPAPAVGGKRELWFSDGYTSSLVKEINSTTGSVGTNHYTSTSVALGNKRYFTAWNETIGAELWVSDGTTEGTALVKNIAPGVASSGVKSLTAMNGVVYFTANDSVYDFELWAYDPSATDCSRFDPSTTYGSSCTTSNPTEVPGRIGVLKNIHLSSGSAPTNLTVIDDTLYFAAQSGTVLAPWLTKGTAFTTVPIFATSSNPASVASSFAKLGSMIIFNGIQSSFSDLYGLIPGSEANDAECVAAYGSDFRRAFGVGCYRHLYKFFNNSPGVTVLGSTNDGSKVFFTGSEADSGKELYVTDGTPLGTRMVKDILPGTGSGLSTTMGDQAGGFAANQFVFTAVAGYEANGVADQQIWITDGSSAGTYPLTSSDSGYNARALMIDSASNKIFFIAGSASTGMELWRSNGTIAGTQLVKDMCPGTCNGAASGADLGISLGISLLGDGRVMLRGTDGLSGSEPLVSDGTAAGTFLLTIAPGSTASSPLHFWPLENGKVIMYGNDGAHGHEPWIVTP
jgi:ELWxxDGT repeat protein